MRAAFDRVFPPGFRAVAGLALLLLALGAAQLLSLAIRDEPFRLAAIALALILSGGGGVLTAFIHGNARNAAARAGVSASDWCTGTALSIALGEALFVWARSGTFFPLRMTLWWRGVGNERLLEPPLAMMLAGTGLVGLGAVATAALCGALWFWLYARGSRRRLFGAALSFAGAVPYVAFALVVRALVCREVALLAAGRFLALRSDEQLAYRSLLGMSPGFLAASLSLGLCLSRGLWSYLEQTRAAEEASDSFLTATVRGERPWQIVLRHGVWLRRRRELSALLLGGLASATLIDILSNTLIDGFRPPGFPPYPTLGAALFLRGLTAGGAPAPLPPSWQGAHVVMVLASLLLLLAQSLPRLQARVALSGGVLRLGGGVLARGVASAHGLSPRPSLQWVLGASGSGKSTLLRAWSAQLAGAVRVPQDPDEALPAALSATDLAKLAGRGGPRGERVLWDLLGRLGDERSRRRLSDPFTKVSAFSRGERQRLLVCLGLARLRADPDGTLMLDEPTSAQDAQRTHAMLDCVRELLSQQPGGSGSVVLSSHDPETLDALLLNPDDRPPRASADHVLWLEDRAAHAFTVRAAEWQGPDAQPPGLLTFRSRATALLAARAPVAWPAQEAPRGTSQRLLRSQVRIAGRRHAVSPQALVHDGELIILSGPSGSGKSTLLREMATWPPPLAVLGYVSQDPARAFPPEMPVRELLGPDARAERVQRWYGPGLTSEILGRRLGALSEGERQRLLLAAEVMRLDALTGSKLKLLLLDEPFGALDPAAHLRLMEALTGWLRDSLGRSAAVLVSHTAQMDLGLARASGIRTVEWRLL